MAATGLQLNWTAVSFPTSATTLTHVTSISFDQGGSLIEFAGDNDRYPVIIANPMNRPKCSITSGDAASLMAIAPGTSGTLAATQVDALGASLGGISYVLINAVHASSQGSGQFGQFGSATASFQAYSADGVTNPLSFTRV